MPFAGATQPDEFALHAADSGGRYYPTSDSMAFAQAIPDEFPYLDMESMGKGDIGPYASLLEEFIHRFQFEATHFGFVYRLCCLIQAGKVLEILAWLGEDPARSLPLPWKNSESRDPWLGQELVDLRALENARRILFGLSVDDDQAVLGAGLDRVKALIHRYTPVRLGHFSTFGGLAEFYDGHGRATVRKTTRAIIESHASAVAFEFLRRNAPPRLGGAIDEFVRSNRRGLYRTIEEMAAALDTPVTIDLAAVVRTGDLALDGKLVDVRTAPPPEDFIEQALPYTRYKGAMNHLDGVREAVRHRGCGDLSIGQQVEVAIGMMGDKRAWLFGEKDVAGGREIQLRAELAAQVGWLEDAEASDPLPACGTFVRREIGWASQRFMRGILSFEPDARRFDPTADGLASMCRIVDLPIVEYPDGVELFRCEPQDIERPFMAWRLCVHGATTLAPMFMRSALQDVVGQSDSLEAHGVPGLPRLQKDLGFSLSQLS